MDQHLLTYLQSFLVYIQSFPRNFQVLKLKKLGALLELIDILLRAFWMNIERAFGSLSEGCLMHLAERIHVVEFF